MPRPDRPSYTIAMLAATRYRDAAELIAEDPGLLDVEAWRLFEVEGGGEDSLANHEKFFGDTWGDVVPRPRRRDPATRERLLDVSLAALARDFATYRAGWFSRFHESLAPTDDERAQRADAYLGLLRSRVGPTVVVRRQRAGQDRSTPGGCRPDALLDRIGPVLVRRVGRDGEGRLGPGRPGRRRVADRARRAADRRRATRLANRRRMSSERAIALIGRLVRGAGRRRRPGARRPPARRRRLAAVGRRGASLAAAGRRMATPPGRADASVERRRPGCRRRATSPIDPARAIEPLDVVEALVDVAVSVIETGRTGRRHRARPRRGRPVRAPTGRRRSPG